MQRLTQRQVDMIFDRLMDGNGLTLSRRSFLHVSASLGGGMLVGVYLGTWPQTAEAAAGSPPFAPNAFVRIAPDGQGTAIMSYIELGQGTYTSIPMLVP